MYTDKDVELYSSSHKSSNSQGMLNFTNLHPNPNIPKQLNVKYMYTITDYTDQYKRKVGHDSGKRANKMAIMAQLTVLNQNLSTFQQFYLYTRLNLTPTYTVKGNNKFVNYRSIHV